MNVNTIVIKAATLNLLSRIVAFGSSLVYIRYVLPHLGAESYGVWMTLISLLFLANYVDFGIVNSLLNKITESEKKIPDSENRYIYAIFLMCIIIPAIIIILFSFWGLNADIQGFFKLKQIKEEIKISIIAFSLHAAFAFMINAFGSIYIAKNKGWIAHSILLTSGLINLLGVCFVVSFGYGLIEVVSIGVFSQVVGVMIYISIFIRNKLYFSTNSIVEAISSINSVRNLGVKFSLIQIGVLALSGLDIFIIATIKGASEATIFSTVQKLFSLIIMISGIINAPLWSIYASAIAEDNKKLVKSLFLKYFKINGVASIIFSIAVYVFNSEIFNLLRFDESLVDKQLIGLYGLFSVLLALNNSICILSNGTSNILPQVKFYIFVFLLILPAKILSLYFLGITEMILVVNILFLIILIPFYFNVYQAAFK